MTNCFERYTSLRQGALGVHIAPDTGKPATAFIHGFLMSRAIWQDNLSTLEDHVRPILIELPGHGHASTSVADKALTFDRMVTELESVRRALGVSHWFLCGHSFGAALAIAYAYAHPNRVLGIAFTNARAALGALESARSDASFSALIARLKAGNKNALRLIPAHPRNMRSLSPSLHAALLDDAEKLAPEIIANLLEHALPDADMSTRLAALSSRVLLVNGLRERGFQPVRKKLEERAQDIAIIDIDAGHSVNAEAPQLFNAALLDFINTLDCPHDLKPSSGRANV
ncbi:MAG: alpha/beta fold hydrolase [Henriciella sp.]